MNTRRRIATWLTTDGIIRALTRFGRPTAVIFAMHRFAMPGGPGGHDVLVLRERLDYMRSRRIDIVSVEQAVTDALEGRPLERPAVAFTVDDGYLDFAEAAAPILAAFDCPITVFLVTDFISGLTWSWWDMVESMFDQPTQRPVPVTSLDYRLNIGWGDDISREQCLQRTTEALKVVPDDARRRAILDLAAALGRDIPQAPPAAYRAMTWDMVRNLQRTGVTFGPHTMTHPILATVDDVRAEAEIVGSWRRLLQETSAPVPVFCYPNGRSTDFTKRDQKLVEQAGMIAAVSMIPGAMRTSHRPVATVDRYALPRYAYPDDDTEFLQIVSGIESWKAWARRSHG